MTGSLVLVATPIGNLGDLSPRAIAALEQADVIACEDTRHSRKLLTHAGIAGTGLISLHAHNEAAKAPELVRRMAAGARVALISDAGTPAISDPGSRVVAAAIEAGIPVEIVPGPSALLAALVVSGLPTERFCFEGFLPRKGRERTERLAAIAAEPRTTVVYEAPHRLASFVRDCLEAMGGERRVVLVRELTKKFEEVWRGTLAEASAHVVAVEPRGEYVVVIDGAPPAAPATEDDVRAALRSRTEAGDDRKTAVAAVASALNVPKRVVYDVSLRD